jgi:predicted hydrocarbon binding protein
MKGMIFTSLADMVEETFGLQMWQGVLDQCPSACGGAYTAGAIYPDEELLCMVSVLQKETSLPLDELLRKFGEYLFDRLVESHQYLIQKYTCAKQLLMALDIEVHRDVEKLYPGTSLPIIQVIEQSETSLTMYYQSPRKICFLAEGLIKGTANHFNEVITLTHKECMHTGSNRCRLDLVFNDQRN